LADIPATIRTAAGWSPRDFVSDGCPPGHYSVWDFFARTEPELFAGIADPQSEFSDVLATVVALATAEGVVPLEWPAPSPLRAAGVETTLIFPDAILRDAIPRNP
jgi:hypothetical protein